MYYVDYLAMIASYLKPSLNSVNVVSNLNYDKRSLLKKSNQNSIKPLLFAFCFSLCIVLVPEKPTNLASICEKYHSSAACDVW